MYGLDLVGTVIHNSFPQWLYHLAPATLERCKVLQLGCFCESFWALSDVIPPLVIRASGKVAFGIRLESDLLKIPHNLCRREWSFVFLGLNSGFSFFFFSSSASWVFNFFPPVFLKNCLFYVCEHTVAVLRHDRRGHQIPLQIAVSHHVVAGNWTQDLWKNSQCS